MKTHPVLILIAILALGHRTACGAPVPGEFNEAALTGQWNQLNTLAGDVGRPGTPYTVRILKGHASLALNQCNEAAVLFLLGGTPEERASYAEWAASMTAAHPQAGLAHYFRADSLARLQKWEDALKEFDAALAIDPKLALAYNGRGVVHAIRKEIGPAKNDFLQAIEASSGELADAFSNVGYLWIQRKDGAKGALESFQKAISKSPHSALALHGKGCIELLMNDHDGAGKDLKEAYARSAALATLFRGEAIRFAAYVAGIDTKELLAEADNPGMSLKSRISADDSLGKATWNYAMADALEKGPGFPGRDQLRNLYDNWGATHLGNAYSAAGSAAVDKIKQQSPELVERALRQQTAFRDRGRSDAMIANETFRMVGDAFRNSGGSPRQMAKELAADSMKLMAEVQKTQIETQSTHNSALIKELSISSTSKTTNYNPGGVRAKVILQNGNWPFSPLYGIGYTFSETLPAAKN